VAITFVEGAATFVGEAITFVERAMAFVGGAVTFVRGAVTFIDKGGSAIGRSFKIAGVGVGNIKGVNKRDLRQRLIMYKLKGPLLLIYSLIFLSDHSIGSSL